MRQIGWSYIKTGIIKGWVRSENIQTKEVENNTSNVENNNNSSQKFGYTTENSVNFRKLPNTSSDIITKLPKNAKLTIIEKGDTWSEVEYNGNRGYVSAQYIQDKPIQITSRSAKPRNVTTKTVANNTKQETNKQEEQTEIIEEQSEEATGSNIIAYAKKYLGYRYRSGGSAPSTGFDCSGFTTYVYKHFGISLSRTSSGQAQNGRQVSRDNLALGDIICFANSQSSKRIGHVGLYIGSGKFIHAANSRQGVIISNITGDGFYFVTARRVI